MINVVYQAHPDGMAGMAGTSITEGEVFFIYQYALSLIGLAVTPDAVPPGYT